MILLNQMTKCVDSRMRLSRIQVVVKMENSAYFVVVKMEVKSGKHYKRHRFFRRDGGLRKIVVEV